MNQHQNLSHLLRWKFDQSAAEAPPPPDYRFAEQEEEPRWWEIAPEAFQRLLRLLDPLPTGHGFAADPDGTVDQPTVPVVVDGGEGSEAARGEILYFNISDGLLRLRFKLKPPLAQSPKSLRVTFVASVDMPVLVAWARPGIDDEFRLEGSLSPTLERNWSGLRATSHMPFRLILQAGESVTPSSA